MADSIARRGTAFERWDVERYRREIAALSVPAVYSGTGSRSTAAALNKTKGLAAKFGREPSPLSEESIHRAYAQDTTTTEQDQFLKTARQAGWLIGVARSCDEFEGLVQQRMGLPAGAGAELVAADAALFCA